MRRTAFTLVELLVVIAIIGLLVALLLPAVQMARESARRMSCQNNLKQIGLALQSYHDNQRAFPPGYVSAVDMSGNDTGPGWGWAAKALPYMEQGTLYDSIRLDQPIDASVNSTPRVAVVKPYRCPSDSVKTTWAAVKRDTSTGDVTGSICDVASAHYVGVFGTTEPGVDGDGIFFRNSAVALREITDGTSQTMSVGERSHRWCEATWTGAVTMAALFPPPKSPAVPFVQNAASMILGHTFEGPPNAPGIECNNFSSQHTSGANFAFADGHVQFITTTIDKTTFRALSTRAGGESVGEF